MRLTIDIIFDFLVSPTALHPSILNVFVRSPLFSLLFYFFYCLFCRLLKIALLSAREKNNNNHGTSERTLLLCNTVLMRFRPDGSDPLSFVVIGLALIKYLARVVFWSN